MVEYYEAKVLHDYNATTSDELRLRVGETIEVRVDPGSDEAEEGWLSGSDLSGNHGTFPANYVVDLRLIEEADDAISPPAANSDTFDSQPGGSQLGGYQYDRAGGEPQPQALASASTPVALIGGSAASATRAESSNPRTQVNFASAVTENSGADSTDVGARNTGVQDLSHGDTTGHLLEGWFSAIDEATGMEYYFTNDGQSSWTKPVAVQQPVLEEAAPAKAKITMDKKCGFKTGPDKESTVRVTW